MICFTECSDRTEDMRVDWTAILPCVRYGKVQVARAVSLLEPQALWSHVD